MPEGGPSFSSVRRARELLRERSEEILKEYLMLARHATSKGDFETAEKVYWKLLSHTTDEEGGAIVSVDVDNKNKQVESGPKGPSISIGVAIGGLGQPQLPAGSEPTVQVIEVERIESDGNK